MNYLEQNFKEEKFIERVKFARNNIKQEIHKLTEELSNITA